MRTAGLKAAGLARLDRSVSTLTLPMSVFSSNSFRGDQAILHQEGGKGFFQDVGFAGLGQEVEDGAFIDRADGALRVRVPGQQDAHGVGRYSVGCVQASSQLCPVMIGKAALTQTS